MIAGLFAEHGVFFGRTGEGDEHNEKGYFEHPEIVSRTEANIMAGWPEAWWKTLEAEGYERGLWWGVKRGPRAWPWVQELGPELIIFCKRPMEQMVRSRLRRWPGRDRPAIHAKQAKKEMDAIGREAGCPVVTIRTDRVIAGDYRQLNKAFERMGMWLDVSLADSWIDRDLWDRGPLK
jgi:hypothetical protein